MATSVPCNSCDANPLIPRVGAPGYEKSVSNGAEVLYLKNPDGSIDVAFDIPLGEGASVTPNNLSVTAGTYVADTVTAAFDPDGARQIQTFGTTTRVGSVRSFSGRLIGSLTIPASAAVADATRVVLDFTSDSQEVYGPIGIGIVVDSPPCGQDFDAQVCKLFGGSVAVCSVEPCNGDKPAIYITPSGGVKQLLGYFEQGPFGALGLNVINTAFQGNAIGWVQQSSIPGLCSNTQAAWLVIVGFLNPIACGAQLEYQNGTEVRSFNTQVPLCTWQGNFTGVAVTNQIRVTSVLIDGVEALTGADIVAAAGVLDTQGASLATQLAAATGLAWTWDNATDTLRVAGRFVSVQIDGLDGATTPAQLPSLARVFATLAGSCTSGT